MRTGQRLPRDLEPLSRSVYSALGTHSRPAGLRKSKHVDEKLPAVRRRVVGAGLRAGRVRRTLGSITAVAAPVVALDGVLRGVDVAMGIAVSVVAVLGAAWLLALRGITVRGARTLAATPRRRAGVRVLRGASAEPAGVSSSGWFLGSWLADFGYPKSSFAVDAGSGGHSGGHDGGDFGGGHDGGGDGGY